SVTAPQFHIAPHLHPGNVDAVRYDAHFIGRDLKYVRQLGLHSETADHYPPSLVDQPPLDIADVPLFVVVEAVIATELRRMHRCDQRAAERLLQTGGGEGEDRKSTR